MPELIYSATTPAPKAQKLVEELQEERSAVWRLYCQLAELKPFCNPASIRPLLSNFSLLLIDYVSLGHFGVYEQLLSDAQHRNASASCADQIYPLFSSTTATAVSFSDQYDDGKRNFKTDKLAEDLSVLGENLAKRMELEDLLCSMLLR